MSNLQLTTMAELAPRLLTLVELWGLRFYGLDSGTAGPIHELAAVAECKIMEGEEA